MSNSKTIPTQENFNLQNTIDRVVQLYQNKGFSVSVMPMGTGVSIDFRKDDGGIKKFIGLALGIKANIMVHERMIVVDFVDAEWTGKILALAVGWIFCFIPFITGIIGCIKQSELPNSIGNDIHMSVGA